MEASTYINAAIEKFKTDGFDISAEKIGGSDIVAARNSQLKPLAGMTQMKNSAVIGFADAVTKESMERFTEDAFKHTLETTNGLPRGMQTGVSCFAVLVSGDVSEDAKKWVQEKPKASFAAFRMPVIVDLSSGQTLYYRKTPIWGFAYYRGFRSFIEKYLLAENISAGQAVAAEATNAQSTATVMPAVQPLAPENQQYSAAPSTRPVSFNIKDVYFISMVGAVLTGEPVSGTISPGMSFSINGTPFPIEKINKGRSELGSASPGEQVALKLSNTLDTVRTSIPVGRAVLGDRDKYELLKSLKGKTVEFE
jgi:hypothetical protein